MFLCFRKIELEEVIPAQALERKNPETPVILEPELYEGIEDLKHRLNRMPAHFRTLLVLEIAGTAQAINEFLKSAPEVRRGRPPAR